MVGLRKLALRTVHHKKTSLLRSAARLGSGHIDLKLGSLLQVIYLRLADGPEILSHLSVWLVYLYFNGPVLQSD